MNPNLVKNPLDRAKYREQYLSNLRLQSSNDQKNQNANSVFKQTGTTPSRPPDMRTTTEKAGDIEGMKVDLRSKLGQITDGVIASQIIGELTADQIRFAIDKWGTIEPDMKKQFASGVPTSAFIAYLNRLIEKFQITDGVETGLQQTRAVLMSNTQITMGLPRPQIWNALKAVLDTARRQFNIDIQPALRAIEENNAILPNQDQMAVLNALPPELQAEVQVLANRMYNNVASNQQIAEMIQEIQVGLANRDSRYTQQAINNAVLQLDLEDSVLDDRNSIIDLIEQYRLQGVQDDPLAIEGGDNDLPEILFTPSPAPPPAEPVYGKQETATTPTNNWIENMVERQPRMYSWAEWEAIPTTGRSGGKYKKEQFLYARLHKNPDLTIYLRTKGRNTPYRFGLRMPNDKLTNADLDSLFESYMEETNLGMNGNGIMGDIKKVSGKMSGKGLAVKEQKVVKPYRQSIAHLIDKPVEKVKPYTQFGRYFINKHRLEGEGIVAFRQPSGNTIGSLPTEKVSKPLAKVIRTLVGKGIPSYEDIGELSKEDKVKLHHICKTCKVNSPAVPKMKGEGEQEEDRFNILRGEIIAGNDSPKIAKEFKVMLLKFVNEGRIPRRQANEILQELLALGH